MHSIFRVLLVTFICSATIPTQAEEILQLDIAGVELGTKVEDAIETLKGKGFQADTDMRGPSFAQKVLVSKGELKQSDAKESYIFAKFKKGYESVSLKFLTLPQGTLVNSIVYKTRDPAMTKDTLRERAYAKYGQPNGKNPDTWTSRPFIQGALKSMTVEDPKADRLSLGHDAMAKTFEIKLRGGELSYKDVDAAIKKAVGPADKSSF